MCSRYSEISAAMFSMARFMGNSAYRTCGKHHTTKHSESSQTGMQPRKACARFCSSLNDVNPTWRERMQCLPIRAAKSHFQV
jgi:hypothetical protein